MNYDLDTPDGMANAVDWVNNCLSRLCDNGVWAVPRSLTLVTVHSHSERTCSVFSGRHDPSIKRVLRAAGWRICPDGYTPEELERDNPYNNWMQE